MVLGHQARNACSCTLGGRVAALLSFGLVIGRQRLVLIMTRRAIAFLLLALASSEAALVPSAQHGMRPRLAQARVPLKPARQTAAGAKGPPEAKSKVDLKWLLSLFRAKEPGWWTSLSKAGS